MEQDQIYEQRRQAVRRLRKQARLTQKQLAVLAGVDRGTICRFESGSKDIKESTLRSVEEALSNELATQKIARSLRGERLETGLPSESAPPPAGTKADAEAREPAETNALSGLAGSGCIRIPNSDALYLRLQIEHLTAENSRLQDNGRKYEELMRRALRMVKEAWKENDRLQARNDSLEELNTARAELTDRLLQYRTADNILIEQLQKSAPRTKELDNLLEYHTRLMAGTR